MIKNPEAARRAVKAYIKANLSAAMPVALSKVEDKLFDPTTSGRNECLVRLAEMDFDDLHCTVGLELYLSVTTKDEDAWVGALVDFFNEDLTLGNTVVLADLQSVDLRHDLSRPDYLFIQVGVELTV
jgi:hypothetical protein